MTPYRVCSVEHKRVTQYNLKIDMFQLLFERGFGGGDSIRTRTYVDRQQNRRSTTWHRVVTEVIVWFDRYDLVQQCLCWTCWGNVTLNSVTVYYVFEAVCQYVYLPFWSRSPPGEYKNPVCCRHSIHSGTNGHHNNSCLVIWSGVSAKECLAGEVYGVVQVGWLTSTERPRTRQDMTV